MLILVLIIVVGLIQVSCNSVDQPIDSMAKTEANLPIDSPHLIILGNVQDAGSPQIGCTKACCINLDDCQAAERQVVSLGLIDPEGDQSWLFEATPDITSQVAFLAEHTQQVLPNGIFLTHAHIGHYAGLMYLGKEALGAKEMPVYTMPRMQEFLTDNGPWSQLVANKNIKIQPITSGSPVQLSPKLTVTPLQVPHRDEFSETVGYRIEGPNKSALFIPDIDKWERWETDISEVLLNIDYALLDATFFDGDELPGRDMAQIPHPFVVESMSRFATLPDSIRKRVHFIHFNHTNPLLDEASEQSKTVNVAGYQIARRGDVLRL